MAAPEKSPTSAGDSELRAAIQARIAARRQDGGRSAGHLSIGSPNQPRAYRLGTDRALTDQAPHTAVSQAVDASATDAAARPGGDGGMIRPAAGGRRRHGQAPQPPSQLHRLMRLVLLLAVTAVSVIGLRTFVIASYYIPSASMETTLHGCLHCEPDMVLVDKLGYRFKAISRTDVVVFDRPPLAPPEDKQLIKRVIGMPGEVVSGHGGHVFIGDKQLVEPYVNPACGGTADFAPITVPAGRYFMMGDNRCDSFDSRMFGTIPRSAIVGRAFAVIWPTKHLRWL